MVRQRYNNKPKRNKTGPKPKYLGKLELVERLYKLGLTDVELATFFEIDKSVVESWIKNYSDFKEARDRGKLWADSKVVESLYRRAIGFSYVEDEWKEVQNRETGETYRIHIRSTKKTVPGDVKAAMFWLSCRHRDKWLTRLQHEHSGKINHEHHHIEDIPVDELSHEAQEYLFEISMKQLENGNRSN